MWFYLYPHCVYHLTRWFPENNRIKFRLVMFLFSIGLIIPELIVLSLPKTSRACEEPLLSLLIASTVFIFFSVGFAFLFSLLDPVPRFVKISFHVFGIGSFILGLLTTIYTFQAIECSESTTELYYWCYASSVLALMASGYFLVTIPFWLANRIKPNVVLNWRRRSGVCYNTVTCCSCVWHV